MYSVYKHTAPNGKVYIGMTGRKPKDRFRDGKGYANNKYFFSAIVQYGWENIQHEIVADGLTKEDAAKLEIELIEKYDSTNPKRGYNHSTGGECACAGVHIEFTEEHRKKISEALKGSRNYMYGQHHSEATRKKMSESHKGAKNHNYGIPMSDEQKQKLSAKVKGRPSQRKKPVICIETKVVYDSALSACNENGLSNTSVTAVCKGRRKTAGGYHWTYYKGG